MIKFKASSNKGDGFWYVEEISNDWILEIYMDFFSFNNAVVVQLPKSYKLTMSWDALTAEG